MDRFKNSVAEYGGFYIARYDAGIPASMTSAVKNLNSRDVSGTPTSVKNAMPWNMISKYTATENAKKMYTNTSTRVYSELINSYAYDTTLNWIISSGAKTTQQVTTMAGSKTWGNYYGSPVTNVTQYSTDGGVVWKTVTSKTKPTTTSGRYWLLPTGHSDYTKANNIYDLAGNLRKITTEIGYNTTETQASRTGIVRGGSYDDDGDYPASARTNINLSTPQKGIGFRVILYKL